jgi:hypothetical protein
VSASANGGSPFSGFGGDLTGTAPTQNVSMTAPRSVTASFGPDFALGQVANQTVMAGQNVNIPVTVTALGGFNSSVNLSLTNLPAGISSTPAIFTPTPTNSSTTISLAVSGSMARGFYLLNLLGSSGNSVHAVSLIADVGAPPGTNSAVYNNNVPVPFFIDCPQCVSTPACSLVDNDPNVTLQGPGNQVSGRYQLLVTANTNAVPGPGRIPCIAQLAFGSVPGEIDFMVWDATPQFTVSPNPIPADTPTTITLTGVGLGVGSPTVAIDGVSTAAQSYSPTMIVVPVNLPAGSHTVTVTSTGNGSNGFQAGPPAQPSHSTGSAQFTATPPVCQDVFINEETVSPSTLTPLYDSLAASPPQPLRNPAAIRRGFAPVFEVTRTPANCGINWNVLSGPGSIIGPANSTLVTVNGNALGTIVLQASSPGGPSWSISVPVVDQINIPVRAVIVRSSNGATAATTPDIVVRDIQAANLVWEQAGI